MTGDVTTTTPDEGWVHPAWLPAEAWRPVGSRRVAVVGDGRDAPADTRSTQEHPVLATVRAELRAATQRWGGALVATGRGAADLDPGPDLVLVVGDGAGEAFTVDHGPALTVTADGPLGLLHGLHHVVRHGEAAFVGAPAAGLTGRHAPVQPVRMLDHWDNLEVHPVMGQVERGYAGGSIFWDDGRLRDDLARAASYARLLGSTGINAVAVNNVNVHRVEARLLTDGLDQVARLAEVFRPWGIRTYLSVSFAAPVVVGGLTTSDPLDEDVRRWWAEAADRVWARIPDFGGFVVKADSEGQPGPFAYGRDHADGANLLARAVAPHGGTVFWRAFVYDHQQDWRDRTTDRARAAHDHFTPLDGRFDDNVVVQVKQGPIDFQVREPVSPLLAAMPATRVAVELQVTQEYTGQQRHVCYLGPAWSQVLSFQPWGSPGPTVADVAAGHGPGARAAGVVAVSNVGDDPFWTGHPLAQANLYAFGRLAWDPALDPTDVLDEWIRLTFGDDPAVASTVHEVMDESWTTYEDYTAPLGIGFMVRPGGHYGPDVDGYEYTPWGTYHFADRDGIGVDRTRATGTGFTGQYPSPWRDVYESPETCPDELLLFFHHVPYTHRLRSGVTVVQHVYDTHLRGVERVEEMAQAWAELAGRVDPRVDARVRERLAEQRRSAVEWRDQLTTYFLRKSGVPDEHGRPLYP
ncbi:alpha-glucuronidase [Actinotalea ferrariae CF5-4]|uniref:Alpha-glucuronidase n=1 Tax=Actinotalea ferrariae CF5-4 TaxID=948458 RepID=A0A021VVZ6_9CELL|nr:alpha-glucuronidase [Actinotalea ferrariae]EYR64215.1 alpha-glucuronidase [Actinotalea ferrariae CF5-4]